TGPPNQGKSILCDPTVQKYTASYPIHTAPFSSDGKVISLYQELLAYEYLWAQHNASLKKIAEILFFQKKLPSEAIHEIEPDLFGGFNQRKKAIQEYIDKKIYASPPFSILLKGISLKGIPQFPDTLLDAQYPITLFYYRGNPDLAHTHCISVVGTRNISPEGYRRTEKLVCLLSKYKCTLVSGLAEGVDTVALETAIKCNMPVIGVIGTPIDVYYPKKNKNLQETIALKHLLISHVPFYKYYTQPFNTKRFYFPERDITMAALSRATIIVEASDTSGTRFQANACIEQKRLLFILNSCFEDPATTWPRHYEKQGAIRVKTINDILTHLINT
ncbi:MAG: DNA-protecting protein DprA, partial [Treponema sp.]|nr:DNA-protecting protein DprA [Treponema sp.]